MAKAKPMRTQRQLWARQYGQTPAEQTARRVDELLHLLSQDQERARRVAIKEEPHE